MKHYTESRDIDKISRLQGEVSDVKDILVKNIGEADCYVVMWIIMITVTQIFHKENHLLRIEDFIQ